MNAVITLAVGRASYFERTNPLMEKYAARIGADFLKITELTDKFAHIEQAYKLSKFLIYDYFDKYDRILYLDGDIVIHPDCPNLFELVPESHLGVTCESEPYFNRDEVLSQACEYYGVNYPGHSRGWFNTGLMVLSQIHRELLVPPVRFRHFTGRNLDGSLADERFRWLDMPLLNCRCLAQGFAVQDLGYKFNYIQPLMYVKDFPLAPEESWMFHCAGEDKDFIDRMVRVWYQSDAFSN